LLRQGYPDWLLLKRGDTWFESLGNSSGNWEKSGRSLAEPMVCMGYGTSPERAKLRTGSRGGCTVAGGGISNMVGNLAFVGIDMEAHTRNPFDPAFSSGSDGAGSTPIGFHYIKNGSNLLLEDMRIAYYSGNITMLKACPTCTLNNFRVRR